MKKMLLILALLLISVVGCTSELNNSSNDKDLSYQQGIVVREENHQIILNNDRIDVDRIEVSKNNKINLEIISLNNNDLEIFEIDSLNISEKIPEGNALKLSFSDLDSGEHEFVFRNSKVKGLIIVK